MINVSIIIPMYNAEEFIIRALDSIPVRSDIEVICVDDCSTDNTYKLVKEYKDTHSLNIKLFKNSINSGTGFTTNVGYDNAIGKWIIGMDNDDYLLTEDYNLVLDVLEECEDYDIVFIGNEVNDKSVWKAEDRTAIWCYFVKRKFLGANRMPLGRWAADFYLTKHLLSLNPRVYNTRLVAYHYNYPREGSIIWNMNHGLLDSEGNMIDDQS